MAKAEEGPQPERLAPGALTQLLVSLVRAPDAPMAGGAPLAPGAVIDQFEIVREIGRGGFGVVYEARDRTLGRAVALKLVNARPGAAQGEQRLLDEAETAARLSHPNLVTLHHAGRCEEGPYLVLELLSGQTLGARLRAGRVPLPEALRVGVEVAKGLAHAHGRGVVHRDLTPGNVFLCDDGQVKVLDLGLAHAFGHRKVDGGTPAYMAPEQAQGAPEDERTDVFALGTLLYESIAGERPFADEDALLSPRPAPALEIPGEPALGELIGRMLSKQAVARPRDAGAVLATLGPLLRDSEGRLAASEPRVRRRPRLRLALLVGAGVLVGAGAAGVVAWRQQQAPPPAVTIAVLPFADMSPHKDQEYLADGVADEIIGALSRVPGLRVVGRTSSFSFKRKEVDLQAIGKALSAGLVLEGSVRTDGDRVRVGAQLVRVAEGSPIWSETYDRELRGILAMERDIAAAVAEALKLRLLPGQRALARRARTVDPEAYRKYLLAESIVQRPSGGKAAFEKAAGLLREAIVLDPTFAEAVADLGSLAYGLGAYSLEPGSVRRGCQAGLELIEKALTIDPELATGYRLRAYRRDACRLEREEAWRDLERAEAIEPGSAKVIRTRAALLLSRGRTREAASTYAQYLELDPLEAWSWLHYAQALAATDDLAGARKAVERALEVAPGFVEGHLFLGTLELIEGRPERARAQFDLVATPGDPDDGGDRISRALVEHDLGRAEEAERIVAPLRERPELAGDLASVYAWWGDRGRAFELIERAVADMDPEAMAFWWDPLWRKLRGDPRFTALLRRLKVDPEAATPAR